MNVNLNPMPDAEAGGVSAPQPVIPPGVDPGIEIPPIDQPAIEHSGIESCAIESAVLEADRDSVPAADPVPAEVTAPVAVPAGAATTAPRSRRAAAVDVLSTWLGNLVISLLTTAFFVIFLYQPVKVEGTSMLPGLEDQERIFVNKFVYHLEPISRGDVIVFRYPRDTSKSYIKRVIGVAGDKIHIVDGQVYVNGEALEEDYVPQQYTDLRSTAEITVPSGSFFMMGDHRNMSSDSRDFGPVAEKYIVGKAVFGYWPVEKLGKVR